MSFTIAHISDPHLSPAPMPGLADLRLKRVMGFINWKRGRARLNDMGMLARLVADLRAQRPDHVAVTGDLVNIGMASEFHRAALWLETFGDPSEVSFVPGNHDAYVRAAMPLLESTFAPWTTGDNAAQRLHLPLSPRAGRGRDHRPQFGRADRPADGDGEARPDPAPGLRRRSRGDWRERAGARRPHSPSAVVEGRAAAARPFRRGRFRGDRSRSRRRGDPAWPHPPKARPHIAVPRRTHRGWNSSGHRRALGGGRRARPALSRRLPSRTARPRGQAMAGQRPRPGPCAGKRGDRGAGGAGGLSAPGGREAALPEVRSLHATQFFQSFGRLFPTSRNVSRPPG